MLSEKEVLERIKKLTDKIKFYKKSSEEFSCKCSSLEEGIKSAINELEAAKKEIEELKIKTENLETENNTLHETFEKINEKFKGIEAEKRRIAEEYASEKGEVSKEREKWTKKLAEKTKENENNLKIISQLEANLAEKEDELKAMKVVSAEAKQKKEELAKKVTQLQQENSGERFTTYPYRLGRTSEKVKNRFVEFVTKMYNDVKPDSETGTYPLREMSEVAKEMKLNEADEKTITSVLKGIVYKDGTKLLDGDCNSKLSLEDFISWITFIKEN